MSERQTVRNLRDSWAECEESTLVNRRQATLLKGIDEMCGGVASWHLSLLRGSRTRCAGARVKVGGSGKCLFVMLAQLPLPLRPALAHTRHELALGCAKPRKRNSRTRQHAPRACCQQQRAPAPLLLPRRRARPTPPRPRDRAAAPPALSARSAARRIGARGSRGVAAARPATRIAPRFQRGLCGRLCPCRWARSRAPPPPRAAQHAPWDAARHGVLTPLTLALRWAPPEAAARAASRRRGGQPAWRKG